MSRVPTIKITLACAYCASAIDFHQGAIELRANRGSLLREGAFTEIRCPHCDSRFSVELRTIRKGKGARMKALEAKRDAEHKAAVAVAIERNRGIAAVLLAQPGCTCKAWQDDQLSGNEYSRARTKDRIEQYGHGFKSAAMSHGVPVAPHHDHDCPCYGTDAETAARGEAA